MSRKKNDKLAPIILFAYNRPLHTRRTLEELAKNHLAQESTLYIYCDGPKTDASEKNKAEIEAVRVIAHSEKWCKEVNIVAQEKNQGLSKSVVNGVTEVVNKHDKAIILEDDLLTAPDFLTFMNQALVAYESNEKIYGVAGHTFHEHARLPYTYLLPIGTSWGWGTWKRAWNDYETNANLLFDKLNNGKRRREFNFGNFPYFEMLEKTRDLEIDSWAVKYYASFFLKGGQFVFPKYSFVENVGFDGTGFHQESTANPFGPKISEDIQLGIIDKGINSNNRATDIIKRYFLQNTTRGFIPKLKESLKRLFEYSLFPSSS